MFSSPELLSTFGTANEQSFFSLFLPDPMPGNSPQDPDLSSLAFAYPTVTRTDASKTTDEPFLSRLLSFPIVEC